MLSERSLNVAGAGAVSITSYNEWGEGTQIEPAAVRTTNAANGGAGIVIIIIIIMKHIIISMKHFIISMKHIIISMKHIISSSSMKGYTDCFTYPRSHKTEK
jgi:hypothetical protein